MGQYKIKRFAAHLNGACVKGAINHTCIRGRCTFSLSLSLDCAQFDTSKLWNEVVKAPPPRSILILIQTTARAAFYFSSQQSARVDKLPGRLQKRSATLSLHHTPTLQKWHMANKIFCEDQKTRLISTPSEWATGRELMISRQFFCFCKPGLLG